MHVRLFFGLKYCMINPGPEECLWDADEPSESDSTMVFARLFLRGCFPAMNVQCSLELYCTVMCF